MASNIEVLSRHVWLIQTILQAGPKGMLLGEVVSKWEDRWGTPYSRKTFCNHRDAIAEIFGIEIMCNRHTNCYYIPMSDGLLDSSSIRSWLINTFTITNALSLGGDRLRGRMEVEDIPSGQLWLTSLIHAMDENRALSITYLKYTSSESEKLELHPYAVKEMDRRWYVVGYCVERGEVRVYGLDRIQSIETLEKKFKLPENFDLGDLFYSSYGMYLPEKGQLGERITFRATPKESKYLRDLPLHHTQKEIEENLFTIEVIPNDNLIMEFCRRGDRIEILSPEDIRRTVAKEHAKAASLYDKENENG